MKALIVIDVQAYFMRHSPSDLPSRIRNHIQASQYDLLAFTVFRNVPDSNWVRTLHWGKCQADEDCAIPLELLEFSSSENTFIKTAYSGFQGTNLETYLQASAIQQVDLCGIDTDSCVLATAFEAFDKGYQVKVLSELAFSRWGLQAAAQSIIAKNFYPKSSKVTD
jgi:nicotinamidase-related amidase